MVADLKNLLRRKTEEKENERKGGMTFVVKERGHEIKVTAKVGKKLSS